MSVENRIAIHWRIKEERYNLVGRKCDECGTIVSGIQRLCCPKCTNFFGPNGKHPEATFPSNPDSERTPDKLAAKPCLPTNNNP